jgi:nucleotide-binding universal stress UspA family protein
MKTLFVATDFSASGNNAVKFAAHYATDIESALVVFNAVHVFPFEPTISEAALAQLKKDTDEKQQANLEQVVNKIFQDLGLKRNSENIRVVARNATFAANTIMDAAKECHADLIILGTHGATGLKMLGSTTSEIIFKSEIPVLAIPYQSEYRKIETVVYATDLKNVLNELRSIVPIASKMKAEIEILNLDFGKTRPVLEIERLMKQLNYDRIKVVIQKEIKGMTILEQLQQYLESRKPEILVMFPEERTFFDKIFVRSKTEELAYQAKLPLLTLIKSGVVQ